MKIKNWNQFIINESFAMSSELYQFIKSNSIDTSEFTDSLIHINDIPGSTIQTTTHIVDQKGHIINVELEEGTKYKFNHTIRINYVAPKSGKIEEFFKIEENLGTISICIQEMISRVSDKVTLTENEFETLISMVSGHHEIKYHFSLVFQSDVKDMEKLKNSYNDYLKSTQYTPEFNNGIKELTGAFDLANIELQEHIDTLNDEESIHVGFVTEDEIYQIGVYDKRNKTFSINWREVEQSIEAWLEAN
jgi:hypothetical protein